MATGLADQTFTIEIFEVGSDLTKIESFHIESWGHGYIESFSPTTYQISISVNNQLCILDIQNSECQLEKDSGFSFHSFSSDGSLFAASANGFLSSVHIWRYSSGRYASWRELPMISPSLGSPLQFSPTLSSILGHFERFLQAYPLDGPPVVPHTNGQVPLGVLSHCGTYTATTHLGNSTITITNLLSQIPPQLVDTEMQIYTLALTGNIPLVFGLAATAAWQLTEDGMVDGCSPDRRTGCSKPIWTVLAPTYCQGHKVDHQQ